MSRGEIIAFGGDPLKLDLPPVAASLLLNRDTARAYAFLSIPGNLRQQYHFACSNWARAYPLLADKLSPAWKKKFYHWIAVYAEARRPYDDSSAHSRLTYTHHLVGQPGELLGGNAFDGGTENHKTMWRTSALLYSQILPDTSRISGYTVKEGEKLTKEMLHHYLKRLLYVGNGEYDSNVYYPYTIKSFMNLYDFSPDPETRQLAKFALDYFFATYGLKIVDGAIAGAQKRGYLTYKDEDMMEIMQWAFFDDTSRDMDSVTTTLHEATTSYRPNKVIWNIAKKQVPIPFEAKIARPFYHMDRPFSFAESYYAQQDFALGNIQMTIVDNPNQQMVWSLVARGNEGPLCFSGGQPLRKSTSGHSPYTQTMQHKSTLILLTAPTAQAVADTSAIAKTYKNTQRENLWILPASEQPNDFEVSHRQLYGKDKLHGMQAPDTLNAPALFRFWQQSAGSASSWFYFPKHLRPLLVDGNYFIETDHTYLAILPIGRQHAVVNPSDDVVQRLGNDAIRKFFERYGVLAFFGQRSGYVLEVVDKSRYGTLEAFAIALKKHCELDLRRLNKSTVAYHSINGDKLLMQYQPTGLRCKATINGIVQDWDNYTSGAVYDSPYLKVKDGKMHVSDGQSAYVVDFTGDLPIWKMDNQIK
ncbi:MAG: hypothetical protein HC819_05655 [Cyclobacteriaceae bacterium]|nr:hypothetical protein [Cyclobacteriaceae bacterium]